MAKIVHFEIPADDIGRARKFYKDLFGWTFESCGGTDYLMIKTCENEDESALKGGMMARKHPGQPIINYVGVDSVSDNIRKVASLGGNIIVPKTPVPGMGYFAVCTDTEKNLFGLWETDPEAGIFADEAEVVVALLSAVVAADKAYSVDEMRFIWDEIQEMEIFKGRDYKAMEEKVLGYFQKKVSDLTPFDDGEIDRVIMSAVQMLDPAMKKQAFGMALKMAHADKNLDGYRIEVHPKEKEIIDRLRKAFQIDPETEARFLDELKEKYI